MLKKDIVIADSEVLKDVERILKEHKKQINPVIVNKKINVYV